MSEGAYQSTHQRLLNWARWAGTGSGSGGSGRCGSIEGRYLPPKLDEAMALTRRKVNGRGGIDVVDAEEIEQALMLVNPRDRREFVVDFYHRRFGADDLCDKYGLHWRGVQDHRRACVLAVAAAVDIRRAVIARLPAGLSLVRLVLANGSAAVYKSAQMTAPVLAAAPDSQKAVGMRPKEPSQARR